MILFFQIALQAEWEVEITCRIDLAQEEDAVDPASNKFTHDLQHSRPQGHGAPNNEFIGTEDISHPVNSTVHQLTVGKGSETAC